MSHANLDILPEPSEDAPSRQNPWAIHRDDVPIEGGFDPQFGDAMWQTLICGDRMQSSDMVLGLAQIPAFGSLPLHRHDPAEFYFITSGQGDVMIDGAITPVHAGVAVFVRGGAEHGITAGPDGVEFLYGFPQNRFGDVKYRFSRRQDSRQ